MTEQAEEFTLDDLNDDHVRDLWEVVTDNSEKFYHYWMPENWYGWTDVRECVPCFKYLGKEATEAEIASTGVLVTKKKSDVTCQDCLELIHS